MPKQPESGWTHSRHLIGEMNNQVKEGMNLHPWSNPIVSKCIRIWSYRAYKSSCSTSHKPKSLGAAQRTKATAKVG